MVLIVFIIIVGLALFKQSNIHSGMVIVSARGILKGSKMYILYYFFNN